MTDFTDRDGATEMAIRLFCWAGGRKIGYYGGGYIKVGSQNKIKLPNHDIALMIEHRAIDSFHTGYLIFSDHVMLKGRERLKLLNAMKA